MASARDRHDQRDQRDHTRSHTSLDPEDVRGHDEREWRAERIGWIAFAVVLLAGATGALGDGPLARSQLERPGAGQVEWSRVARQGAPTSIALDLASGTDTIITVAIDRAYHDVMELESVVPEPESVRADSGAVHMRFQRVQQGAPLRVTIGFRPVGVGTRSAHLTVPGGTFTLRQLVLP